MELTKAYIEKQALIDSLQTVVLSTIDDESKPYTSYAPFMSLDNDIYIMVSKMAKHTQYLQKRPFAGLLFIEDESKTRQIFFRKRLYLDTVVTLDILEPRVIEAMKARFGDVVTTFMTMDFIIVKCAVQKGQLILGAGAAYTFENNTLEHITGTGHRSN